MKIKKVLLIYMKGSAETLAIVKDVLADNNIKCKSLLRNKKTKKDFDKVDLVITVGGDGTFLRTAHFIENMPILGVNSNVGKKEGFFTRANKNNFKKRFESLLKGKNKLIELTRLKAKLNNRSLDRTLNEVFVGTKLSYKMARYELEVRGRTEYQKSSGIIIGTAAGSYAWIRSCKGRVLNLESKSFQYVVREPYIGKLIKHQMINGLLNNGKIKIRSLMKDGIVIIDSLSKEYKFKIGDVLVIERSSTPLKFVSF